MKTLIDTLNGENGQLYTIVGSKRLLLAKCQPVIELYEHKHEVKVLGTVKYSVKTNYSAILDCGKPDFVIDADIDFIKKVSSYELVGDFLMTNGIYERKTFNNCLPIDIDLTGIDNWRFEIETNGTLQDMFRLVSKY